MYTHLLIGMFITKYKLLLVALLPSHLVTIEIDALIPSTQNCINNFFEERGVKRLEETVPLRQQTHFCRCAFRFMQYEGLLT